MNSKGAALRFPVTCCKGSIAKREYVPLGHVEVLTDPSITKDPLDPMQLHFKRVQVALTFLHREKIVKKACLPTMYGRYAFREGKKLPGGPEGVSATLLLLVKSLQQEYPFHNLPDNCAIYATGMLQEKGEGAPTIGNIDGFTAKLKYVLEQAQECDSRSIFLASINNYHDLSQELRASNDLEQIDINELASRSTELTSGKVLLIWLHHQLNDVLMFIDWAAGITTPKLLSTVKREDTCEIAHKEFAQALYIPRGRKGQPLLEKQVFNGVMHTPVSLVWGTQRSGKTWLQHKLFHELSKQQTSIPVYCDLAQAPQDSLRDFFLWLRQKLEEKLKRHELGVPIEWETLLKEGPLLPSLAFQQMLYEHILSRLSRPLVLILDNFDALANTPVWGSVSACLFSLAETVRPKNQVLRLCLASTRSPTSLLQAPFYRMSIASTRLFQLGNFEQEQLKLLAKQCQWKASSEELKRFEQMIGGHPLFARAVMLEVAYRESFEQVIKDGPLLQSIQQRLVPQSEAIMPANREKTLWS